MTSMTSRFQPQFVNPAVAYAAAVRPGDTKAVVRFTVEAEDFETVLLPYDALAFAKDLVFNPGPTNVTLEYASGRILDAAAISSARF